MDSHIIRLCSLINYRHSEEFLSRKSNPPCWFLQLQKINLHEKCLHTTTSSWKSRSNGHWGLEIDHIILFVVQYLAIEGWFKKLHISPPLKTSDDAVNLRENLGECICSFNFVVEKNGSVGIVPSGKLIFRHTLTAY